MEYHVAICDDVEADRLAIGNMVRRWAEASGCGSRVDGFPSAESFLFEYDRNRDYDILLLDVEMRELSGIELAKRVRAQRGREEIVFITSHFEFIAEGYEVDALHYLVKPVAEEKLFQVLDRAASQLGAEPPSVVVSCQGETVKLFEADILYVEAFSHTVEVHTRERVYTVKEGITAFGERLGADFYRVHRSYIVNLRAVERISRTDVIIEGGVLIPLSREKYDDVNRAFIERN